jgi:hypothetical protein
MHHSEYPNAKDEEPQIVLCVERNSNESHVIVWWRTRLAMSDRGTQQQHKPRGLSPMEEGYSMSSNHSNQ